MHHQFRSAARGLLAVTLLATAAPAVALAAPTPAALFGTNLIANGDAEAGPGSPSSVGGVVPVPGWTTSGNFTVVEYETEADVPESFPTLSDPGPPDRGTNFFVGGPNNASSSASQDINLGSTAKLIDAGLVSFSVFGWFGGFESQDDNAVLEVAFRRANGQIVGSAQVGAVTAADRGNATGLLPRAGFGTVPAGTRTAHVTLRMTKDATFLYNDGYADNVGLVLTSLFGSNIVRNPGAELGDASPDGYGVVSVPGWTTTSNFTVARWDGDALPGSGDPGPADRGSALFAGGPDNPFATASQTIDVSAGARLIDTGIVPYSLSAFLGGWIDQRDDAVVTIAFMAGTATLGTATIGPVTAADRGSLTGLLQRSTAGVVPAGTRAIVVTIEMTRREDPPAIYNDGYVDGLRLLLGF